MGTINIKTDFAAGTLSKSSEMNTNFSTLESVVNGNIENVNIKAAAAIAMSKIANALVEHSEDGTHGEEITLNSDIRIRSIGVKSVELDDNAGGALNIFQIAADNTVTGRITMPSAGNILFEDVRLKRTNTKELTIEDSTTGDITKLIINSVDTDIKGNLLIESDVRLQRSAAKTFLISDNAGADLTKLDIKAADTDINGNLTLAGTSDKYIHAITTKTLTIDPSSAKETDINPATIELVSATAVKPSAADSGDDGATQSIVLPVGVTITRIDVYGATTATSTNNSVTCSLNYRNITGQTGVQMASVSFNNGGTTGNDTTISSPTISSIRAYFLTITVKANSGGSVNDAKYYGIKITYTMVNSSQTI